MFWLILRGEGIEEKTDDRGHLLISHNLMAHFPLHIYRW